MSEIPRAENEELYRALGLEELIEGQVFEEDPILSTGKTGHFRTPNGFIRFFENRDWQGSPAEGYGALAYTVNDQLKNVVIAAIANKQAITVPVRLKPESLRPDGSLYNFEEDSATIAFRLAIEEMLHLQQVRRCDLNPDDVRTVYAGRFMHPDWKKEFYLPVIETVGQDEVDVYRKLEISSKFPADAPSPTLVEEEKPFVTTSQTEEAILDLYSELGKIPTAPVDEVEIVRNWIGKQAA